MTTPYNPKVSVAAVALVLALGACKGSTSKEDIDRLVDQRLAERGLAPSASASSAGAPSSKGTSLSPATTDAAAASLAFLARLDELMKDFKPEVPAIEDKGDLFRCVTTDAAKTDPQLKKAVASLKGQANAGKQAAKKRADEFYATVYPLAFHIDLDWATRKTAPVAGVYECWNAGTNMAETEGSQAECESLASQKGWPLKWRARVPDRAALFVYSNSETPPSSPPELMGRMATAGLEAPARFSCRVDDVVAVQDRREVRCRSTGPTATLRLGGEPSPLNVGDVVSVPLANAKRDPDGVLFKKGSRWVVDADAKTLTVDVAAKCPSAEEILGAVGGGAK